MEPEDFATREEAESWIGELWTELRDGGTEQVTLMEDNTEIYTMNLRAVEG